MDHEPNPSFEDGQDIRDRTFAFACRVVMVCQQLYALGGVGRILAPQLVDCSTSLAAMLEEARGAESTRDFISKCSIGLKEANESHVRLRILDACKIGPGAEVKSLCIEGGELGSIVGAIIRNTKRNARNRVRIPNS